MAKDERGEAHIGESTKIPLAWVAAIIFSFLAASTFILRLEAKTNANAVQGTANEQEIAEMGKTLRNIDRTLNRIQAVLEMKIEKQKQE